MRSERPEPKGHDRRCRDGDKQLLLVCRQRCSRGAKAGMKHKCGGVDIAEQPLENNPGDQGHHAGGNQHHQKTGRNEVAAQRLIVLDKAYSISAYSLGPRRISGHLTIDFGAVFRQTHADRGRAGHDPY